MSGGALCCRIFPFLHVFSEIIHYAGRLEIPDQVGDDLRRKVGEDTKKRKSKDFLLGVPYGIRTHDIQNHNLTL